MYFNVGYIIFMLPVFILSILINIKLKVTYNKYSIVLNDRRITGAQAAEQALKNAGVYGVRVERTSGKLTDHYSPKDNVIRLSKEVYDGTTIAAVGIACHEAGHAIQYDSEYAPIKIRNSMVPVTNIGSKLGIILIVLGIILSTTVYYSKIIFFIGIVLYSLVVVFQLVTLPIEFNASRRAMESIRSAGILSDSECVGARKVLTAAALTYVAALITSIMEVLYYISISNRRKR